MLTLRQLIHGASISIYKNYLSYILILDDQALFTYSKIYSASQQKGSQSSLTFQGHSFAQLDESRFSDSSTPSLSLEISTPFLSRKFTASFFFLDRPFSIFPLSDPLSWFLLLFSLLYATPQQCHIIILSPLSLSLSLMTAMAEVALWR